MIEYFKKAEHHFCYLKMFETPKNERRKKLSNSNHHELLIISIDFILMVIEKRKLMILNDLIGKKLFLIEKQRYHTRYVLFMIRNHKLPYKGEDIFQKWI